MAEHQQVLRAGVFVGYLAWFVVLVRVLFLSTGNPYTNTAEILGSHVGLAFWLLVLSVIPYFMARARAKKNGTDVSWPYVMVGITLIALVLSVGGFYGRTHMSSGVVSSAQPTYGTKGWTEESTGIDIIDPFKEAPPVGTRYYRDAQGIIYRVYPPGVRPDLPTANPFGLGDSTVGAPPNR